MVCKSIDIVRSIVKFDYFQNHLDMKNVSYKHMIKHNTYDLGPTLPISAVQLTATPGSDMPDHGQQRGPRMFWGARFRNYLVFLSTLLSAVTYTDILHYTSPPK